MLLEHPKRRLLNRSIHATVIRNSYLPQLTIQIGIGNVKIKVPKIRDRSCNGICFNNSLLHPYLKRVKNVKQLLL
ncbi:MAG: hypothetical protein ACTS73_06590 [Arsenophonus sp. NEOnobi-MAG3]